MVDKGICPVCNGTGRMPCPDHSRRYGLEYGWFDYNKEDDTIKCSNCGARYMSGTVTGMVRLNKDGQPCTHTYTRKTVGRCLNRYTCQNCNDSYEIDSSD